MARRERDIKLKVKTDVDKAQRDLNKIDREIDELTKSGNKGIPVFKGLAGAAGGFIAALSIRTIAQGAMELGKLGAVARNVERDFRKIEDSQKLFEDLRKALRGGVSDLEIMRQALIGLDLGATNDQMKIFAEFATFESVRKGTDKLKTLKNILGGVLRGSTELLDNFGISFTQVNREIENLARASGKSATGLSAVERRTMMVQAAVNIMNQRLKTNTDLAVTNADKADQAAAAWDNLNVAVGKLVDQPVSDFFGVAADVMNAAADTINNLEKQFISLQLAVLNRINPSFEKLLTGLDEHSRKIIDNDEKVGAFKQIWAEANIQLEKGRETLKLLNNLYGENSKEVSDQTKLIEELAKRSHDAYLLMQQRVVELRKELGKPLELGPAEEPAVFDLEAAKKMMAIYKRMADEYENAMELIRESGERSAKEEIELANEIIAHYENLHKRNVELDREQIAMVKEIAQTNINEAIAVTDALLENWEFTEDEKKRLLELRKQYIQEASEYEIEQARTAAAALTRIFEGPMNMMVQDFLEGTRKAKDIFNDFIDYLMAEIRRFLASQLVATFFQFIANSLGGGSAALNFGSLFLSPQGAAGPAANPTAPNSIAPISTPTTGMSLPKIMNPPAPNFAQTGSLQNITNDNRQTYDMGSFQVVFNAPVYGEDQRLLDSVKKLHEEHMHRTGRVINKSAL